MRERKYLKFKSVTWWASFVPIVAGFIVAGEPLHGWVAIVSFINELTGDLPASVMINAGIAGIGLRGAVEARS